MKTFAGNKSLVAILAQCAVQGVPVDLRYLDRGGDYAVIGKPGCGHVLYNAFNGRFHGVSPDGVEFDSNSDQHDGEPWMQALLSFFYVESTRAAP